MRDPSQLFSCSCLVHIPEVEIESEALCPEISAAQYLEKSGRGKKKSDAAKAFHVSVLI